MFSIAPRIDVLKLAQVNGVPEFHPEHRTFASFPVHGFVIHHPDGAVVVDTGIGFGNDLIDSLYPHDSMSLIDELNRLGVDERDVQLIANSHLHFDHCGQNHALSCPIAVQKAEIEAARQPHYTVDEWATIPSKRARVLDGDAELCAGVHALLTPGHTPGHQAILIDCADGPVVIAAQCIFRRDAWDSEIESTNIHDEEWRIEAARSLTRLRALRPQRVLLSHDTEIQSPTNDATRDGSAGR